MYTGKYPRWFTDNALGLRPRALSETTSRIFPVYTGYLGYNLYIHTYMHIHDNSCLSFCCFCCTRCHGFRQPWIPIRQPGKRHFTREERGIEIIATVTVLKKERPDSLGADIFNEISELQNFDCYVIMTVINRAQTSV